MAGKRKILYLKSVCFGLGISLLIHFFILLLYAGYNAFNSPFVIPVELPDLRLGMLAYSFCSIFFFLTVQFIVVFRIQGNARRYKAGWILLAVFAVAFTYGMLIMRIYIDVYSLGSQLSFRIYLGSLIGNGFLSLLVIMISYVDFLTRRQQVTAIENQALKAQNIQSRYEALKNQIDPHFLFNTFSSLTSMIELDAAKAQEFSIKMSSVLRYTLQAKDLVTLAEEMEFTRDYCTLMQIRYGDNLRFRFAVDPTYDGRWVVPLSVQTLIENVVKHNEISNRSPLTVHIHTNDDSTLTVSNPINLKRDGSTGTGLGLANLKERYMLKFRKEVGILSNKKIFMVTIPLVEK